MAKSFLNNMSAREFRGLMKETTLEALEEFIPQAKVGFPEILTPHQACDLTGFSIHTLYRKTSRKEIPHFKRGGKLFFRRDALVIWITQGKVSLNETDH